jgi:hypothetical protein
MVAARRIILAIFVPTATFSTMVIHTPGSSATSTRLFGLFSMEILVLVLLPMLVDYFNGCVCSHSLGIVAQIKNMGAPPLVFASIWYNIHAIIF